MQTSLEGWLSCRVVLVIPNWNGRRLLEPCLSAVFAQEFQDFAVILVDNGSTDGSVDLVRTRFPQVRIIENDTNRGFAAANNQAIRASTSEFVATLNNDTEVNPRWLGALVEAMDVYPQIGMCASKMLLAAKKQLSGKPQNHALAVSRKMKNAAGVLGADQRKVIEATGIVVDKAGMVWNRDGGTIDRPIAAAQVPVFGACAGAALYRRAMLDEIGLFDEDFFAYMEDVDLSWRAQWAGWKCVYAPDASVYHIHSATGKEGSHFKNHLLGRNKIWLLCKNYPLLSWHVLLVLIYDLMSVGYTIVAGRRFGAVQGRIEALGGIPRMLAKRRRMLKRMSPRVMLALLHPVENPFMVLRRYAHI